MHDTYTVVAGMNYTVLVAEDNTNIVDELLDACFLNSQFRCVRY